MGDYAEPNSSQAEPAGDGTCGNAAVASHDDVHAPVSDSPAAASYGPAAASPHGDAYNAPAAAAEPAAAAPAQADANTNQADPSTAASMPAATSTQPDAAAAAPAPDAAAAAPDAQNYTKPAANSTQPGDGDDDKESSPGGPKSAAGPSPYGDMFGKDAGTPYVAQNNSAAKAACAPDDAGDQCRADADAKDQQMAAAQVAAKNPDLPPDQVAAQAQQVSDIRMGNTDIKVDPNGDPNDPDHQRYLDKTMDAVEKMQQSPSANNMVNDMADTQSDPTANAQHTTVIQPPAAGADTHVNAANAADAHNGVGTDTTISYDPTLSIDQKYGDTVVHQSPDTALDHEMVHANYEEHGTEATGAVDGAPAMPPQRPDGSQPMPLSTSTVSIPANDACLDAAEYQGVGLPTKGNQDYSLAPYSEDRYRAEQAAAGHATPDQNYAQRPAYVPDDKANIYNKGTPDQSNAGACGTGRDAQSTPNNQY